MEIIQIKEGVAFPMLIFPIGVVDKMEKSKLQIWFKFFFACIVVYKAV